jgi:hypothetical protein
MRGETMGGISISCFAQALLAAAAASLILAAGAASRTAQTVYDAPVLVSPVPGSSFAGGTPIVFQIRATPDDSLMQLVGSLGGS